ncbi:hypothetical protein NEF87_003142 [Candidatus Lokiarchaeum ossiferum]|uniref:THUMP-like domain-containing protein n=1 Tax=Candidatus Lokiarchaeum ossiferum TaxID=2951803 RepID=A0ABY6HVF4_9ARCH|nr:hypothetical protein NEF87_003142 [Candidatus Lokiarchaeum sp. B-35]
MQDKLNKELWNKLLKIRDKKRRRAVLVKIGYSPIEIEHILADLHIHSRAKLKYPRAEQMQFTQAGLEQASSKWLAEYRTLKMKQKIPKISQVLEVCSGIGGDTIAQSLRWKLLTVEKDPEIIALLKHNLNVYNLLEKVQIIEGDILELLQQKKFMDKLTNIDAIIFDPSRRHGSDHTVKIEEYLPPLSILSDLEQISPNIVVKIAPGVDFSHIPYTCDIEVVSYKGSVKETMLWFGKFMQSEKQSIIATKLPENISIIKQDSVSVPTLTGPKQYIYEPDPAFIKAHVINDIANEHKLTLLHEKLAYLTNNVFVKTPILKCYQYIAHCDLDFKKINNLLKLHQIGRLDYKSRGVKIDLKTVHKSIEYHGKRQGILIFTLVSQKPSIILCKYC